MTAGQVRCRRCALGRTAVCRAWRPETCSLSTFRPARRVAQRLSDGQFVAAAVITAVVEVGLVTLTVPQLTRLLGIGLGSAGPEGDTDTPHLPVHDPQVWLHRRQIAVERVLRNWPFGDTCLRRSLVLGQRIRRLDPVMIIGVRRDEHGDVVAHAWLTVGGTSLDPSSRDYAPLSSGTQV